MKQSIRVMLASEYPAARSLLRRIVESEDKTVVVGEAENGTKALTLARNLRPDVAIIDSYLPYVVGLDDVPLSRVGGLDVAQSISAEIPNIRVVLLNRLERGIIPANSWGPYADALFCREEKETCIPFRVGDLDDDTGLLPGTVVYANVESKTTPEAKTGWSGSDAMFFGVLSLLAGWSLIITVVLLWPGVLLVSLGTVGVLFGLVGKITSKTKRGLNSARNRNLH